MSETSTLPPRRRVLISAGAIDGGRSGVGRYVIELVAALSRDHSDTYEILVAGLDADRGHFPAIDERHWVSISPRCGGGLMSFLWHQLVLPFRLRRKKIDVLHSPTYRRILWWSPAVQVATIHDCAPFVLRDKYGFLRGLLGRRLAPMMARRCRRVIAVSHQTAADLQRYMKLPKSRIDTVWNGIDHQHYRPTSGAELSAFLKRNEQTRPYFLYVARLEHPGKNHVGLVAAYEQFRQADPATKVQLVLGGSDWMGAEAIHARIAASPYRDDIRVLGFVPDEDLPLWYSACIAVVMPTLFEGFGLPVIEAYACGAAAGLSDIGALREVGGELAEFFDAQDSRAMAACLHKLAAMALPAAEPEAAMAVAIVGGDGGLDRGARDGDTRLVAASKEGADSARQARREWSQRFSWERCASGVRRNYDKSHN